MDLHSYVDGLKTLELHTFYLLKESRKSRVLNVKPPGLLWGPDPYGVLCSACLGLLWGPDPYGVLCSASVWGLLWGPDAYGVLCSASLWGP